MTTENNPAVEFVADPVLDAVAAEQAKQAAEMDAMLADMQKRRAEEAVVAAEQDAALQAVRDQCDAYRAALKSEE
jgi:hypothetical protein